ncbi:MAG: 30S ribosomal protein S4 [Planctomycetota bacterium]|jgi:small subunit ribosomal protein S4
MARYTGPKCRLCRREGTKLFLKGTRCETAKCALNRRESAPGIQRWRRPRFSEYGRQLREKQKVKRFYGLLDKQFKLAFRKAETAKGNTGANLLVLLERRLDNVVLRGGFALSRAQGRQLIAHEHIQVNGGKVDIPSYLVKPGDVVRPRETEDAKKLVLENLEIAKSRETPSWLTVNQNPPEITMVQLPTREEVAIPVEEQLVVEILSR